MIKVTVDTNILVSGTFWTGDSFRILDLIDKKLITNVSSRKILDEYSKACLSDEIIDKIQRNNLSILKSIEKIVMNSVIVHPKSKFNVVKDDPADNKILETAFEGKVDYIITQDNHLLKLKEFRGIKIVTPKDFLELIK